MRRMCHVTRITGRFYRFWKFVIIIQHWIWWGRGTRNFWKIGFFLWWCGMDIKFWKFLFFHRYLGLSVPMSYTLLYHWVISCFTINICLPLYLYLISWRVSDSHLHPKRLTHLLCGSHANSSAVSLPLNTYSHLSSHRLSCFHPKDYLGRFVGHSNRPEDLLGKVASEQCFILVHGFYLTWNGWEDWVSAVLELLHSIFKLNFERWC